MLYTNDLNLPPCSGVKEQTFLHIVERYVWILSVMFGYTAKHKLLLNISRLLISIYTSTAGGA